MWSPGGTATLPVNGPAVALHSTGTTTVLSLAGRFDGTALRAMEQLVDQIGCSALDHLAVDAAALDHIDEAGLQMLVCLDSYMRARGGRLTVVATSDVVDAVLRSSPLTVRAPTPGHGASRGDGPRPAGPTDR